MDTNRVIMQDNYSFRNVAAQAYAKNFTDRIYYSSKSTRNEWEKEYAFLTTRNARKLE